MRAPMSWLREYVTVDAPVEDIARRLRVSSLDVTHVLDVGVADTAGNLDRFLVGRVLEVGAHPNADRLRVCQVDVGEDDARQIVCGAWNFEAGATVAVALPGAYLPILDVPLDERELRGQASRGMILAEDEIGLGEDHAGIVVLPEGPEPGTPLVDVLPIRDRVLDVTPTVNRVDLLSMVGVAREVAALLDGELHLPDVEDPPVVEGEDVDVTVEDLGGCPRYIGRLFRDVAIGPSPQWLRSRLYLAEMRSISNVVDVTNYVMHVYGSPLHAFDRTRLSGGRIVVRRARAREELRTLDGTLRRLETSDLVIADADRAVALAAIMGGGDSEVVEDTTEVLLEAANFEPLGIMRSSERLAVRTAGSNRWEKGVDPHLAGQAAALATELIVSSAGARWTGEIDVKGTLPERPVVRLRPERADKLIGVKTPASEQRETLERLGFEVDEDWDVVVPTWRARDVSREADVIEEIARFRLPDVPFTLPLRSAMVGRLTADQRLRRVVEDVLVGLGFFEAYTSSLLREDPDPRALRLPDPLSAEQALLRTTLVHGLIEAAQRNVDVGNENVALFEIARVYLPADAELPDEHWRLGGITQGGFSAAKGAVEALHDALHVATDYVRDERPLLHPRKAARFESGWVGELHPAVLEGSWGVFELDLATLFARIPERIAYEDVITYPALRQDLAFIVGEDVSAGDLIEAVREAAGEELREARVFDVYRGEQIPAGTKSIALHVAFQSSERTLSDEDATAIRDRVVGALAERFGAELRA
jgi:phenylalanyl-tRNA synthetase beta chain